MNRLIIFITIWIFSTFVFSGCKKDDNSGSDQNTKPTISFITGTGYTSADKTVIGGTVIKVGINASKGPNGSNISRFKIESVYNSVVSTVSSDSNLNTPSYSKPNIYIPSRSVNGVEKFKFEVTDKSGNTSEIEFNITTQVPLPTLNYKGGTGYTTSDKTVAAGTVIKVGIMAAKSSYGSNLVHFKIERVFNSNTTTFFDTTLNNATFSRDNYIVTRSVAGIENFKFEITDLDGNADTIVLNITTTISVVYGSISTWPASGTITLGAQGNSNPGFFASSTGSTFTAGTAAANVSVIDICYGSLPTNDGSLISPSEWNNQGFSPVLTGATITHFDVSAISASTFDLLHNDSLIKDIPVLTHVLVNVTNNVYQFINANGKKGLIKITNQVTGTTGSIGFVVKVQQ
jgi:hypothetical protein